MGPEVRLKFWKLSGRVSAGVDMMLPKRGSIFQLKEPTGMKRSSSVVSRPQM